jgi:His/Glu/Gln/Arg/opine family amino acid ABC transporter permease subunit
MIDWGMIANLVGGAVTTLWISSVSIAIGAPLGLLLAMARVWRVPVLSQAVAVFVSIIRATPVITLALFVFFGIPAMGLTLSPTVAALITLSVNTSAFHAEIWRASIMDFPQNQSEAASAFGMTRLQAFRLIVLPQAWRASLPPMVNEMTFLIKSSPAIAVIGVVDLTRTASRIAAYTYDPLPPYISAAIIYAVVVFSLVRAQRVIERMIVRRYGVL